MPSPGPTLSMPARKIRLGDVVYVDPSTPRAVVDVYWTGIPGVTVVDVHLTYDDGTSWVGNRDTQLDVTRPFIRHAETGDHDL